MPRTWIPPSALIGNTAGATPLDMFLRESTQQRVRGDRITHLQLAEGVWNPTTQRADTRFL